MNIIYSAIEIVIVCFALYFILNKYLIKCIALGAERKWIISHSFIALLLPIACNILNKSPSFAFNLSLVYLVVSNGFSANYKFDDELYEKIEVMQRVVIKYSIITSILGYLSYASIGTIGK